ncbi:hypothetical protein ACFWE5_07310 [Cellulosimicrobium funkei]|uniref:hypothetical protein n=1 Tax=Cellulosimicrobium funkei TaxID=264251 RepID=UPI0036572F8C
MPHTTNARVRCTKAVGHDGYHLGYPPGGTPALWSAPPREWVVPAFASDAHRAAFSTPNKTGGIWPSAICMDRRRFVVADPKTGAMVAITRSCTRRPGHTGRHACGSYLDDRVTAVWERAPRPAVVERAPAPAASAVSGPVAEQHRMPGAPDVARLRELLAHTKRVAEALESAPAGAGPVALARHLVVNLGLRVEGVSA